ncbi:MAG: EAL domain-containing protein [Proteobacteria bacterium]|nr:EAL domain-containing protein [Burkholderiales bacterium]
MERTAGGETLLTVAHPWVADGRVVGFVELGIPLARIVDRLEALARVDVAVLDAEESPGASERRVVLHASAGALSPGLGEAHGAGQAPSLVDRLLASPPGTALPERLRQCSQQRCLQALAVPLSEVRAGAQGVLVLIQDVTELHQASRAAMSTLALVAGTLGALGLLTMLLALGRVDRYRSEREHAALVNRRLQSEVIERARIERELKAAHERLDHRVAERTAELRRINEALADEIVERKAIQVQIRDAEQRLDLALQASELALFDLDLASGSLYLTEQWALMRGDLPQAVTVTTGEFIDVVHPEDRAATEHALEQVARARTAQYSIRHRIRTLDGDWRQVHATGKVVAHDESGRPLRLAGTLADVTRNWQMVEAVTHSEARFRSLTELSSDWYWEQDAQLRFTEVAGQAFEPAGVAPAQCVGRHWAEVAVFDMPREFWVSFDAKLTANEGFRDVELRLRTLEGALYYVTVSGRPLFDEQQRFLGYRGTGRNVTERKWEEARRAMEHAVTATLAESGPVQPTIARIIETICTSQHWNCGGLLLFDSNDGALYMSEAWGDGAPEITRFVEASRASRSVPAQPGGVARRVWRENRSVWLEDIGAVGEWRRREAAEAAGIVSAFAFPIRSRDATIGVLEFFCSVRRAPDQALLDSVQAIGLQLGQFIERKEAETKLRLAGKTVESAAESIVVTDERGYIVDVNPAFSVMTGYERDEVMGRSPRMLRSDRQTSSDYQLMWSVVRQQGKWQGELWSRRKNGEVYPEWVSICAVRSDAGEATHFVTIATDISQRKVSEERLQYLANYDPLTQLPNRAAFNQHLEHAIHQAQRHKRQLAVMFVDLDRFKMINDSLGHEAGDRVLREAAGRLHDCVRASDTVCRLGGDEFVIIIEELATVAAVAAVAEKILQAIARPFIVEGQEFHITASMGIAGFPEDGADRQQLLKNSDVAMYRAKELGKNKFQFYSAHMNAHSFDRMVMEAALRRALERGELELWYQARIELSTQRIAGAEALLRWRHPQMGLVLPGQFITLAEETGLIVPIGEWVLDQACQEAVSWQVSGLPPIAVAVNLSARQFAHETLVDATARTLERHALSPGTLELEITESMVMNNPEQAVILLTALKAMGCHLSIDDFGTGYSSLAQLKRFPVDSLKIDRSFVRDLPGDTDDAAITRAVIAMAHSLKLRVVAEGVETREQLQFLREHGCDDVQGYLFGRPMPAVEFARALATDRLRHSAAA